MYLDLLTDYKTFVQAGEYNIKFDSTMPEKHHIINYGLPKDQQLFKRTQYEIFGKMVDACDITKKVWNSIGRKYQDEIADKEWHRRKNGQWYYIGGKTIYIVGEHYFFLNYYTFEDGSRPQFWDSQWVDFHLIHDSFYAENVLGIFKVKGRRGGGTTVPLSCELDYGTRIKGSKCGNINKTEDDAREINFVPIKHALMNLAYFFIPKPYRDSIEDKRRMKVEKSLEFKGSDRDELNSIIDFKATTTGGYDGGKMRFLTWDEYAKKVGLDIVTAIRTNVLCVKDGGIKHNIKDTVTGEVKKYAALLYLLSSIDEISETQIARVNTVYAGCAPETATSRWCSTHGIRRYFEPFYFGFKGFMDKFGFSMAEEARVATTEQYNMILATEGKTNAREFRRQHPETIDDALTPSSTQCVFDINVLVETKKLIQSRKIDDPKRPMRGRLQWIVRWQSVQWIPMPDADENDILARWEISGHPSTKNHIAKYQDELKPLNADEYVMASDPIDYDKKDTSEKTTRLSKPSFRVKRLYDAKIDGGEDKWIEHPETKEMIPKDYGADFETNRTVCTYLYRPDLADEFYEDAAMTAIYYGTPMLNEKSISMRDFMVENKMGYFLYDHKCEFFDEENYESLWISTTDENKRQFFSNGSTYIGRMGKAERHAICIEQLFVVTPKTMTKQDMAASWLICEYADHTLSTKYDSPLEKTVSTGLSFGNFGIG